MESFFTIHHIVIGVLVGGLLFRPATRSERAKLLFLAEDNENCIAYVDRLLAKKWLTWFQYDHAKAVIYGIKGRAHNDAMLAESAARKIIRDQQNKVRG